MPTRLIIFFLLILTACNTKPGKVKAIISAGDTAQNYIDTFQANGNELYKDTFLLNGQQVIRSGPVNRFNGLTNLAGDSLIAKRDYYADYKFLDIDKDGYKDIRVYTFSNTPNQCDTYIFNKTDSTYKKIANADLDFMKLGATQYYYSYNRIGCGDNRWESHLMKIENWKEIDIGEMIVSGCGDGHDGVEVLKTRGDKRILIDSLPLPKFNNNGRNNKWAYLKNYWAKNYGKFE